MSHDRSADRPHVVVLGAGFGGLTFCHQFAGHADVTLVDQQNHHVFQPLLYQVATSALSAPDIAAPIRRVLRHKPDLHVVMDSVERIDLSQQRVTLGDDVLTYDHLVIALGGVTSYFGHDAWQAHALGLKTLADAMKIRQRVLSAFERAETTDDPAERKRLMTIVVVGGGPTGVELAGSFAELTRRVFRGDFRRIDPTAARIILIEAHPRVLPPFPEKLSEQARKQLEELGVTVWTGMPVQQIERGRVVLKDRTVEAGTILWGAGVQANPVTQSLGIELERGGRIPVLADLSVPGHRNAFAIGDIATLVDANGKPVPGVAPAAIQMGKHVAKLIARELDEDGQPPQEREPFRYRDRGTMATIGRSRAVAWIGKWQFSGLLAWLAWLVVHLISLIGFRNKLAVLLQWFYAYVRFQSGARIIMSPESPEVERPEDNT